MFNPAEKCSTQGPPWAAHPRTTSFPSLVFALPWAKISRRSHHPVLRYPQLHKQTKNKSKLNITQNATLYGEITMQASKINSTGPIQLRAIIMFFSLCSRITVTSTRSSHHLWPCLAANVYWASASQVNRGANWCILASCNLQIRSSDTPIPRNQSRYRVDTRYHGRHRRVGTVKVSAQLRLRVKLQAYAHIGVSVFWSVNYFPQAQSKQKRLNAAI